MNDNDIEQEIQTKGLKAPRVTMDHIEAAIDSEEYHQLTDTLTVCVLTLKCGYTVTGESACVSPENFDADLGRKIARGKAIDACWPLFGFHLAMVMSGQSMGS